MACAAFLLTAAGSARAFPSSRLVYARGPGAESCPERDVLSRAVAARLGYDPFLPSSDKTIVARIVRENENLKGQVELIDERGLELGLREFSAAPEQCDELVKTMALSISIAIDPHSAETYSQAPPDEPPTPTPEENESVEPIAPVTPKAPTPLRREAPVRKVAPAREHGFDWSSGVGLNGTFDAAPRANLGALALARVARPTWSLGVQARVDLPMTQPRANERFRLFELELTALPCLRVRALFVCESTAVVWLQANGTREGAQGGSAALFALGAVIGGELGLSQAFGLLAELELSLRPWPTRFLADGQQLWKTPILREGAALAAVLHF